MASTYSRNATGGYDLIKGLEDDPRYGGLSDEDKNILTKQQLQQQYGGMGEASLGDFKTLLGRLENSKIRQQQAKDISARPNIYAQGLAQMMSNF
jgi:hypothetical protein